MALRVTDLRVSIAGEPAVRGVSFDVEPGRRLGIIGESGCGKTLTALAVMGLLPKGVTATGHAVLDDGFDTIGAGQRALSGVRGRRLTMVFQEPMTALNPVMTIGRQVAEPLTLHGLLSPAEARREAIDLLGRVGLADPAATAGAYPHQLSGGQRQRVVLAIAVACRPEVIIADEPTTALDVTTQAQILRLLSDLVDEEGCGLVLISHNLPVVASVCDDVMVMYGGHIVELGPVADVVGTPRHPYTAGLLDAIIDLDDLDPPLRGVPGVVPALGRFPSGCVFRDRCERATERCSTMPELDEAPHAVACWHPVAAA